MKIATWNVNSLNVRRPHLRDWLAAAAPDIVALQETKMEDVKFPHEEIGADGLSLLCFQGKKTYNGVAILARDEPTDVVKDVPGLDDPQRRILAASVGDLAADPAQAFCIINLYVVNGQGGRQRKVRLQTRLAVVRCASTGCRTNCTRHSAHDRTGRFQHLPGRS